MKDSKIDLDNLMAEILSIVHQFDLEPKFFALTLHLPKEQFDLLSQQHPGHHPRFISISKGNQWMIDFSPALDPGEYPDAQSLTPDAFRTQTEKGNKRPKKQ